MTLCPKHYWNTSLQLLLLPKPIIFPFKNHLIALTGPCWLNAELHRVRWSKIPLCHRQGNIGGCNYNRVVKAYFSECLAPVSCAEDAFGFKNDWDYSGWAYPNSQTFSSNNWIMQYCFKATPWRWGESSRKILVRFELFPKEACSSQNFSACGRLRLLV